MLRLFDRREGRRGAVTQFTQSTRRLVMTAKELVERLSTEDQDALVYTMAHDDDIALIVTEVKENVLEGKDETVILVY